MAYSLAYALRYHIAHTRLPLNLPSGYLPTDTCLSTIFIQNLTLSPVMPTHYSDIHHSLYIPIRYTLHTITQPQNATTPHVIILYFPSLLCYVPHATTICIIFLMMGIVVTKTRWTDIKFAIKLLVASSWLLFHILTMHRQTHIKFTFI